MKVSIGFSTSDWWVSRVIKFFTRAEVSHAYVVFDAATGPFGHEVFEAAWCGFRMSTRGKLTSGTARIVREIAVPLDAAGALAICRAWLETPYDYPGLFGEAWVQIGKLFGKRWANPWAGPHRMFCSEAATYLLQMCAPAAGTGSLLKNVVMPLDARQVDPETLERVLVAVAAYDGAVQTCTRPAPHVCQVNGPCNGWPKA